MHILRGIKLERFSARARHNKCHESTFRKMCLFFKPLAQQNVPLKDPFSSEKHLQDSDNLTPCQCFSPKAESRSASRRRARMAPVQVSEAGRQATDQTTLTPPRRSAASPPPAPAGGTQAGEAYLAEWYHYTWMAALPARRYLHRARKLRLGARKSRSRCLFVASTLRSGPS